MHEARQFSAPREKREIAKSAGARETPPQDFHRPPRRPSGVSALDVDVAAAERLSPAVVVDDMVARSVRGPDPDLERVRRAIDGSEQEAVPARAVQLADALELRGATRDHQPLVAGAVEVESTLHLELDVADRDHGALQVLRHEAEVRLAG